MKPALPHSFRGLIARLMLTLVGLVVLYFLSIGPVIYVMLHLGGKIGQAAPTVFTVPESDWSGKYPRAVFYSGGTAGYRAPNPYPFIANCYRPFWWVADHSAFPGQSLRAYGNWWTRFGTPRTYTEDEEVVEVLAAPTVDDGPFHSPESAPKENP